MDWIQLIGAVGIGAIVTKLLDLFWLQRLSQRNERERWLRDQRVQVYAQLTEELLSEGVWRSETDPQEATKLSARAILLTDEERLAALIDDYIPKVLEARRRLDHFINNGTSTVEERRAMRQREQNRLRDEG